MPTFLVFKNSSVSDTIRGANPAALRAAVSKAASDAGKGTASSGANFSNKGYTLGTDSKPGQTTGAGAGVGSWFSTAGAGAGSLGTSWADSAVRFFGLYLTTLFSFDAYAAADASPFKVGTAQRR